MKTLGYEIIKEGEVKRCNRPNIKRTRAHGVGDEKHIIGIQSVIQVIGDGANEGGQKTKQKKREFSNVRGTSYCLINTSNTLWGQKGTFVVCIPLLNFFRFLSTF